MSDKLRTSSLLSVLIVVFAAIGSADGLLLGNIKKPAGKPGKTFQD